MPLSDIPLSVLVTLFLSIFVLIGIYPLLQKSMARLRKLIDASTQSDKMFSSSLQDVHDGVFTDYPGSQALNDFEIIVLRRIAQAGGKALSRKQVNEPLLFGHAILSKTLKSLYRRGYLDVRVSKFLGQRFVLSESGQRYALEQGYIIQFQERKGFI